MVGRSVASVIIAWWRREGGGIGGWKGFIRSSLHRFVRVGTTCYISHYSHAFHIKPRRHGRVRVRPAVRLSHHVAERVEIAYLKVKRAEHVTDESQMTPIRIH